MNEITIYSPYYNSEKQLKFILNEYSKMSLSIRKKLYIFIVDDGSLTFKAIDVINSLPDLCCQLNLVLHRIDIDIPWNMPEANNLAFSEIKTDYIIRSDIDHFFYESDLIKIFELDVDKDKIYKFKRNGIYFEDPTIKVLNTPKNVYMINKDSFWKTNGYNEYFSGNYGDDKDFIPRVEKILKYELLANITINTIINGHTCGLDRDITQTLEKLKNKDRPFLKFQHKDKYLKQYENILE